MYGRILHLWGQGIDPTPLKPYWQEEDEKSIGHSHTPQTPAPSRGREEVLYYLAVKTARRIRQKGYVGRVVYALFRDEELGYHGVQKALSVPTCDERVIYATALAIVEGTSGGSPRGSRSWACAWVGSSPSGGSPGPSSPRTKGERGSLRPWTASATGTARRR
ncbi:hypothetical protein [Candidatus Hadarchaeum sp.]|uniref:DinB/UmuC family translesion DNA polymerase n=1 Tax=Candidatus Hadarchaeum sp. TaxID=2883567 RepID=UPI003857BA59